LITIGSNCALTKGVKIFTHGGARVARRKYPNYDVFGMVEVGDYCYIGTNSLIMPGVKIGNGSMVAAGSVVTKSVPPNMVVGGNPARILCTVDEYIERNKTFDLESKGLSYEQKRTFLLSLPKERFIRKKEMV
jgi:acetyltransferase-like isoleucine patch superfamily enzyme